ncbi:MAG: hypothetical protein ABR517_03650 [Thermoanaerobaculia bacterium]
MEQHIEWTAPAALWDDFNGTTNAEQRRIFRTPAILRFATDDFMEQFLGLIEDDPRRIRELLVVPETWRKPPAEVEVASPKRGLAGQLARARTTVVRKLEARQLAVRQTPWNPASTEMPLKLYQPAHQRYYLVTACLVCRTLGLPDKMLDTTQQERATFVIRMLEPAPAAAAVNPDPALCTELALVGDEWKRVTDTTELVAGEVQYPLSPASYTEIDGRRRRMFNGTIPVAKREALAAAKRAASESSPREPMDPRRMLLKTDVIAPWAILEDIARVAAQQSSGGAPDPVERMKAIAATNDRITMVGWYILLDLDRWLEENLPAVWDAVTAQSSAGLSATKLAAYQQLATLGLVSPLRSIRAFRASLESAKTVYRSSSPAGWPTLAFRFVTASYGAPTGLTGQGRRDNLENALAGALEPLASGSSVPVRSIAQVNATDQATPWFTVRCIYERPNCPNRSRAAVSDPTAAFQMASFFDPDAPARPIRVVMPADTTPAGLRKFDKNAAFVLSDVLCGQVSAVRSLGFIDLVLAVLPWPLHKDLSVSTEPCSSENGMVCSLSIPIITICALIVLMIMVKLLDMIFYWLPFFQICLPVPNFDGKKE